MKNTQLIYILIFLFIVGIGVYTYNSIQERKSANEKNCAEIGLKFGEKNRAHLKEVGTDKTDIYEDEYIYNKETGTCLYYKSQRPYVRSIENQVLISTQKIIDTSTNKEILSFLKILNPEGLDLDPTGCISSNDEKWECETEDDFDRIKSELFE